MAENFFSLEQLVGQRVAICPRTEMNRKRLFTLQHWIDPEKLTKAIMFGNESEDIPITALVSMSGIHQILTLTGGNHRMGVACVENTGV